MKRYGSFILALALLCGALAPPVFAQSGTLGNPAALNEKAPPVYKVRFDTSKGAFVVEVHRDWAPNGADRFYNLVKNGFYDDTRFFRVVSGFMVQFGINGDPNVSAPWRTATIKDNSVKQSNKRGYITFATSGPDSRTSQVSSISPTTRGSTARGSRHSARSHQEWGWWTDCSAAMAKAPLQGVAPIKAVSSVKGTLTSRRTFPIWIS